MSRSDRHRVLAIGVDAAEPALVRAMVDQGELPCLRSLVDRGAWGRVRSPAHIGSGAVWPSFLTGHGPLVHGIHSQWSWDPHEMRFTRISPDRLTPFWRDLVLRGRSVCVLDVPFAPLVGLPGAVEVAEWGAHDRVRGRLEVSPAAALEAVRRHGGVHPFAAGGAAEALGPHDHAGLSRVVSRCLAGARQRGRLAAALLRQHAPDLLLVVFTEVHHAAHLLWHTVDPSCPAHDPGGSPFDLAGTEGLPAIVREVDRQIAQLVAEAGPESTVLVFSLHGMRATRGVPSILGPLLEASGLARVRGWRGVTWPERAGRVLGAVRRRVPPSLKRLLYRPGTRTIVLRLGTVGTLPAYEWSRTLVFPLPTDQHGWLRVNLAGREARGIVDPGRYDELCAQIERLLRGLTTTDRVPVVKDVLQIGLGAPPRQLPDLVVHWHEEASASPVELLSPRVSAHPTLTVLTGQHGFEGFFVLRPGSGSALTPPDSVAAEDLHRILLAEVGSPVARD